MRHGFSLVELSIVLVILGLLTGGILAGQSLIRAAELRTVSTQDATIIAAIHTFRDKYFALPGDMNNATKFWNAADPTPATCQTTSTGDARTCDGNGDGQIGRSYESHRFWQHLANAGLIEGTYSGVVSTLGGGVIYDTTNTMRSKFSNYSFAFNYTGPVVHVNWFAADYGHVLSLGPMPLSQWTNGNSFVPQDIWNIDTKMDDGRPGLGKVVVYSFNNCVTTTAADTSQYNLTSTTMNCVFMHRNVL